MPREMLCIDREKVEFQEYEERPLQAGEVRIKTLRTAISHGTEMAMYRGRMWVFHKRFDPELRLFLPAEQSRYPMRLGYECTGRITEVDPEAVGLRVGDLVFAPCGHRETQVISAEAVTRLPEGVSEEAGIFVPLGCLAFLTVHDAGVKVGDEVAVFGLGTIGLLAVQAARLQGATRVTAVDPIPRRREAAQRLGADLVIDPEACDPALEIKHSSPYKGADIAIEAAGAYSALNEAIRSVRVAGTVATLSYLHGESKGLSLGEEWLYNRVTMHAIMGAWGCPSRHPLWERSRLRKLIVDLLARGRLETASLISHRIPFEQIAEAYRLIDERPEETTKVLITYQE